jgi:RNA polymerase primary sigma factor
MKITSESTKSQLTPLIKMAIVNGGFDALVEQISRGFKVNSRDSNGKTALMLAAARGHSKICALLLKSGAEIDLIDLEGNTALANATKGRHEAVISMIVAHAKGFGRNSGLEPIENWANPESIVADRLDTFSWEVEPESERPASDLNCLIPTLTIQANINKHMPVDSDEDWTDVDIYFPEIEKENADYFFDEQRRWLQDVRRLFEIGCQDGVLSEYEIDRIIPFDENDAELILGFKRKLHLTIEDAGIEILDKIFLSDFEDKEDGIKTTVDKCLEHFKKLILTNDDYPTYYFRDVGKRKEFTDQENELNRNEVESATKQLIKSIVQSATAMQEMVKILTQAYNREIPIESVINLRDDYIDNIQENQAVSDGPETFRRGKDIHNEVIPNDFFLNFEEIKLALFNPSKQDLLAEYIYRLGLTENFTNQLILRAMQDSVSPDLLQCVSDNQKRLSKVRSALVERNLKFAIWAAKKIGGLSEIDRIQEANYGLIIAAEKFDFRRARKFSTYAVWWIRATIFKALNEQDRTIRLPANIIQYIPSVNKATERHLAATGQFPTDAELSNKLDLPQDKIRRLRNIPKEPFSLDDPTDIEDHDFRNTPNDAYEIFQEERFQNKVQFVINDILSQLPSRNSEILSMLFGIGKYPVHTLQEIGDKYGLSRERVRQIGQASIKTLSFQINKTWLSECNRIDLTIQKNKIHF